MLFSLSKQAFWDPNIGTPPDDAVEITDDEYVSFFTAVNSAKRVYKLGGSFVVSEEKPSKFHEWSDEVSNWIISADSEVKQKTAHVAEATAQRDVLRAKADTEATPLQDAADLNEATEEESALLKKWKQYRVALNRLDLSTAPDISWPEIPSN